MTTPIDPYANATSSLPSATQSIIPAAGLGLNNATINTSDLNVSSAGGGVVLGYTGEPGAGNIYFSLSPTSTSDIYGNTVNTGLTCNAGSLTGMSIVGAQIDSTTTLQNTQVNNANVLAPTITGGTAASLVSTMTNDGGGVLGYTSGNSSVTFATNGNYLWTCPTGITQAQIQCWGAGGGGGGGNSTNGGESGGAGEYSSEPAFSVVPGTVYSIIVGQGGSGGSTNNAGADGSRTIFQNINGGGSAVTANPGLAGVNGEAGVGGSGSTASINFDGGDGAGQSGNTGGAGGGAAGSATSEGADGTESTSSSGGAGGSNPPSGAGGNGGNDATNGSNGGAPGGGGGGAGANNITTSTKTYPSVAPYSYYGPNAMGNTPNGLHSKTVLYQGQPGVNSAYGYQYSFISLDYGQIVSDLAGVVVQSVSLKIKCLYSYYSTGVYCEVGYVGYYDHGNTGSDADSTPVQNFLMQQNETVTHNFGLAGGIGAALQSGAARSIQFGPGAIAPWQDYYGSFDTGANGGVTPEIIVTYAASNGSTAGTGHDGQCIITYNSGTVPTYALSVSAQQSSDAFGNPYNAGFTGPQLTLTPVTNLQTTISTAVNVGSNVTSTAVQTTNAPGFTGTLPATQMDVSTNVVTGTPYTVFTKAYGVPAGDPQLGTVYRLTSWGNLHTASPTQSWSLAIVGLGATLCTFTVGASPLTVATYYDWYVTGLVQVVNLSGSSGSVRTQMSGTIVEQGINLGNSQSTYALGQTAGPTAISTSAASTLGMQTGFSASESGQTAWSYGSMLERIGP